MHDVTFYFLIGAALPLGLLTGSALSWLLFNLAMTAYNLWARYDQASWYEDEVPHGPAYHRRRLQWAWSYMHRNNAWTTLVP